MKLKHSTALMGAICTSMMASGTLASSHREAPHITQMPKVDATDLFAFNSYESGREGYVTLIANYMPFQEPFGGPNYFSMDPAAVYSIHVDNTGDAVEDLTFQFRFSQRLANEGKGIALSVGPEGDKRSVPIPLKYAGLISPMDRSAVNFFENYTLTMVQGDRMTGTAMPVMNSADQSTEFGKPLDFVGTKTFSSVEQYQAYAEAFEYTIAIPGCETNGRVFVGQRNDPFAINVGDIFDLVNFVPVEGDSAPGAGDAGGFPGGITQTVDEDDLRYKNVTSLALEVPAACLTGSGNGNIGVWTTASLPQARILNPNATFEKPEVNGGAWTQVSRLGNPLVNEVVIGLSDKDRFNTSEPMNDAQFLQYVAYPTMPELLNTLFKDAVNQALGAELETLAPTLFPRTDLITTFLQGFEGVNQLATVTPSEMMRLNTTIAAKPASEQQPLGVLAGDLAGFPNGRRPGDDITDIELRVLMGRLCYPLPISEEGTNLGFCMPEDADVGNAAFTDGVPMNPTQFKSEFPYLVEPIPGSMEVDKVIATDTSAATAQE